MLLTPDYGAAGTTHNAPVAQNGLTRVANVIVHISNNIGSGHAGALSNLGILLSRVVLRQDSRGDDAGQANELSEIICLIKHKIFIYSNISSVISCFGANYVLLY